MTELEMPQFNLEFYKPGCIPLRAGTPEYETALRGTTRYLDKYYHEQIATAQELEVEKPKWFREAETDARLFMSTLAFDDLMPIVLFANDRGDRVFGPRALRTTVATQEQHVIMVKREAVNLLRLRYGRIKVGSVLVHELTHATTTPRRMGVHLNDSQTRNFVYGNGLMVGNERTPKGEFFEEGFAEYLAGYYVRSRQNNNRLTPLISVKSKRNLSTELPPHYAMRISDESVSGPDGYAIELLAAGINEASHGRIPPGKFVSILLESRRPETAMSARREFIQAMEQFHPGLYKLLRDLPYSRENWQKALNLVHALVTQE